MFCVANVVRMNVTIHSLKIMSGGAEKELGILSLACYAVLPLEVFCEAQDAPNLSSAGSGSLRRFPTFPSRWEGVPIPRGEGVPIPNYPTHSRPVRRDASIFGPPSIDDGSTPLNSISVSRTVKA